MTKKRRRPHSPRSDKTAEPIQDLPELRRARALWVRDQIPAALRLFDQTARRYPAHPFALADAGRALGSVYHFARAETLLAKLVELGWQRGDLLHLAGQSYRLIRRPQLALACFRRAVELGAPPADCWLELAVLAERQNELETALAWTNRRLHAVPQDPEGQVLQARILRRLDQHASAENLLRQVCQKSGVHWLTRQRAHTELAGLLDQQGSYRSAWQAMESAKALARPHAGPARQHRDRMLQALQRIHAPLTRAQFARWRQTAGEQPEQAVALLTGLPRSGTTLLEHMLAAHPNVAAADEWDVFPRLIFPAMFGFAPLERLSLDQLDQLTESQLARKRHAYFRCLAAATQCDLSDRLLLDKNPSLLPLVPAYLRLLPTSRLIVVRRDPRDVLLSCLMTMLPLNDFGVDFLTLEDGAQRIRQELLGWNRLRELLDNEPLEVHYEDLITDWRATLTALVSRLGLPWHPALSEYRERVSIDYLHAPSYAAVQQPISTVRRARWLNYADQLAPILPLFQGLLHA